MYFVQVNHTTVILCVRDTNSNLMGDDHIIKNKLQYLFRRKTSNDSHVLEFVKNCMEGLSQTGKCVCGQGCPYPTLENSQWVPRLKLCLGCSFANTSAATTSYFLRMKCHRTVNHTSHLMQKQAKFMNVQKKDGQNKKHVLHVAKLYNFTTLICTMEKRFDLIPQV